MDLDGYEVDDFTISTLNLYLNQPLICKELMDIICSFENVEVQLFKAEDIVGRELHRIPTQRSIKLDAMQYQLFFLYNDGPLVVNEAVKAKIEEAGMKGLYFKLTSDI